MVPNAVTDDGAVSKYKTCLKQCLDYFQYIDQIYLKVEK